MLTEPAIKFAELPEAGEDGECVTCQFYPNEFETMSTDQGDMKVVKCSVCETLMRAHGG
jgi:hypothetical protein